MAKNLISAAVSGLVKNQTDKLTAQSISKVAKLLVFQMVVSYALTKFPNRTANTLTCAEAMQIWEADKL